MIDETLNEFLLNAKEELSRAEQQIFVSLKYTRTADVIKNAIERLISTFDACFEVIFEKLKRRRKELVVPEQYKARCETLRKLLKKDKKITEAIDIYLLLKDIAEAKYDKKDEYHRTVTMIAYISEKPFEINIDKLYEYFGKAKELITYFEEEFL
jgi:hypothetical protein